MSGDLTIEINGDYHNLGSLQGTLEEINLRGRYTITIRERVSRLPIRCHLSKEVDGIERVKGLVGRRVLVTGDIHYLANGSPRHIVDVTNVIDDTPNPRWPKAGYGSIPDKRVMKEGGAKFLRSVREER